MMPTIAHFTFNPFQENTYVIHDETGECVIIDPGCYTSHEQQQLVQYLSKNKLKPVRLLNTHCHIDHILGNAFIQREYEIALEAHAGEIPVLDAAAQSAQMFGMVYTDPSPHPTKFLNHQDWIQFGVTRLQVLLTPGHSPASVSFWCPEHQFVIAGDVLFQGSIGRTDLPGGNFNTLIQSIKTQLFPLGDMVVVWPGHGPQTSIGFEKTHNPFLNGDFAE